MSIQLRGALLGVAFGALVWAFIIVTCGWGSWLQ